MTDRWSYKPEDDGTVNRRVTLNRPVTVGGLAEALGVKVFDIIKALIEYKVFAKNGDTLVQDYTAILLVAEKHGADLMIED